MQITHTTVVGIPDDGTSIVGSDEWNAAHTFTVSATARLIGRASAGAGAAEELTGTQATALLDNFTATLKGLVPLSGGGTGKFLRADGWAPVPPSAPQGRVTLVSNTPVLVSLGTVTGATTVYYTPFVGQLVPIYDGTNFVMTDIGGELSQTTSDTTKSPAAVTANGNYDIFVWNDSGTIRATRGPAWSTATTRGTGAGTTELTRVQGWWVNAQAITNGPAANRGTYVGTIHMDGSNSLNFSTGTLATGGRKGELNVWNMYNRVLVPCAVHDITDNWTYAVANTWRAANNSANMRVDYITGMQEEALSATYMCSAMPGAGTYVAIGIGSDSTTAFVGANQICGNSGVLTGLIARVDSTPAIGFHYLSALEYNNTTTASTWYGDNGQATWVQSSGLFFSLRM